MNKSVEKEKANREINKQIKDGMEKINIWK